MGLGYQEREAVVTFRLEKAQRTLEQAKGVVNLKYWPTVANRLYYAAYYAVSALLIANGDSAQTHAGVLHVFGLHFIKSGIVSHEMGAVYSRLFTLRLTGDYGDDFELEENQVLPLIAPTEELINTISALAKNRIQQC